MSVSTHKRAPTDAKLSALVMNTVLAAWLAAVLPRAGLADEGDGEDEEVGTEGLHVYGLVVLWSGAFAVLLVFEVCFFGV